MAVWGAQQPQQQPSTAVKPGEFCSGAAACGAADLAAELGLRWLLAFGLAGPAGKRAPWGMGGDLLATA